MKKRLRKKLRRQEFQELVFHVRFELTIPNTDEANSAFADKLFSMLDANQLLIGGSLSDFYVQTEHCRSATQADRAAVQEWLGQQPEILDATVGPLVDAWHGQGQQLSRPGTGLANTLAAHVLAQAGISA